MMWIALAAALAGAGSLSCESEGSPKIQHESWSKSGGARPSPETVVSRESWTVGDQPLHHVERKYGDEVPDGNATDLEWTWDLEATTDVEVLIRSNTLERVRYRTRVTLVRPSGASLGDGLGSQTTVWMTCLREERRMVP